jgi:hypothetical protein
MYLGVVVVIASSPLIYAGDTRGDARLTSEASASRYFVRYGGRDRGTVTF